MEAKKSVARILSIIIIIAVLLSSGYFYKQEQDEQIAAWNAEVWFAFSNDVEEFPDEGWLLKEKLENYKPKNDVYNSRVYYEKLNADEKLVYNAFEYALDNNYTFIYIDNSMVFEKERDSMDILNFLALDTPIVQQNLDVWLYEEAGFNLNNEIMHKAVEREISGIIINVENFSKTRTSQIYEAVEKLKATKIEFPENATDNDKAWAIFDYICEEVVYSESEENATDSASAEEKKKSINYLYEAVINGATNCDGFANMFSFLCNVNGLRCFEKNSCEIDTEEEGHTWNTVLIDGEWYNVDCTPALEKDRDEKSDAGSKLMRFGFSDDMQLQTADYKGMYPECEKGIIPVAYSFETCDDEDATEKIAKALKESEDGYIIVSFKEYDKDELSDLIWNVVYWLYSDIYYVTHEGEVNNMCYIKMD